MEAATHWRFADLRLTPSDTWSALGTATGRRILGVATAEPLHRADVRHLLAEMAMEGLLDDTARLLVVGLIGPGPGQLFDPGVLVPAWQAVLAHLPDDPVLVVSPLPTYGHDERDRRLRDLVLSNHGATDRLPESSPGEGRPG